MMLRGKIIGKAEQEESKKRKMLGDDDSAVSSQIEYRELCTQTESRSLRRI